MFKKVIKGIFIGIGVSFTGLIALGVAGNMLIQDELESEPTHTDDKPAVTQEVDTNLSDALIMSKAGEAIFNFVAEASMEISTYASSGDVESTVAYALGVIYGEENTPISVEFANIREQLTDEGCINALNELEDFYYDYIDAVRTVSEGNFEDAVGMINDINMRIPEMTQIILDLNN